MRMYYRLLVRRIDGREKAAGGSVIPETTKEKPPAGETIAARPARGMTAAG
jgi:chaperonin GroES